MWPKIGGSILVLIGVICFGFSLYWLGEEVLLDATGRSVNGVVESKYTTTDENNNISYYISYSYEDASEHSYTAKSDVYHLMFDESIQGSPISVTYSSAYPSISRIRSAGEYLFPSGMFILIGIVPIWFGLRMILTGKVD